MASSFSTTIFLLCFLFLVSFSCAKYSNNDDRLSFSSNSFFPKRQAEKLIAQLNLFPDDDVNVAAHEFPLATKKIVEKTFKLPALGNGPSVQELGHHAGYYKLPHSQAARMFYLFFESRTNKNDPIVIWLTGGPGCSSELAVFYENGPFQIANNLSLVWSDYGWDTASNLLYVDQPTGTGFSYTSDEEDIRHDENGVSNDLYDFLQV